MITVCNNNVTRVDVKRVPLQRPEKAGRFWKGIPHSEFLDILESILNTRKWKPATTGISITPNGYGMAAAYDITIPGMKAPAGTRFGLGVLHDNNRKRAVTLVCGARVMVCNNGMATGNVVLKHKHTSGFNLRDAIDEAMDRYLERARVLDECVTKWKEFTITGGMSDRLLMGAARAGVLCPTRIYDVDREFRNPSFDYEDDQNNCSLRLYNAFTHVMKKAPARFQLDRMEKFRHFLPVTKRRSSLINIDGEAIELNWSRNQARRHIGSGLATEKENGHIST